VTENSDEKTCGAIGLQDMVLLKRCMPVRAFEAHLKIGESSIDCREKYSVDQIQNGSIPQELIQFNEMVYQ